MPRQPKDVNSERRKELGRRMERAALEAGFSSASAIARPMGVSASCASRWWTGENVASVDEITRYAELVKKPVWWLFVFGDEDGVPQIADLLLNILKRLETDDLATAFEAEAGYEGELSRRERVTLNAGTAALRQTVSKLAGQPLSSLPADRARKVVDHLIVEDLLPPHR